MTQELYKKYRPRTLNRVIGNEDTVAALESYLEKGTLPHTVLFHGPSGCGKTTLARILRKELKCSDIDFTEVNCADFRGIDSVRDIMRAMMMKPMDGDCRVWLIDECHRLTGDAQDAFLKALEDTPKHVYFFLATTVPNKLVKTIRTRCCEMPVRALTDLELEKLLKSIAKREDVDLSEDVIEKIASMSLGSARMALVILDKMLSLPEDRRLSAIEQIVAEENKSIDLCRALLAKESWSKVAAIVKGLDAEQESIRYAVLGYCRAVLLSGGKQSVRAALIMEEFAEPTYSLGNAGIALYAYRVICGD